MKNAILLVGCLVLVWLAGCQGAPAPAPVTATATAAATDLPAATATASPVPPSAEATPTTPSSSPTPGATVTGTTETPMESATETATATTPAVTEASPTPGTEATVDSGTTSTPESTPTALPEVANPEEQACTDLAAFYGDLTIPDDTIFYQGDSFEKGWRLRNNGSCTWGSSYAVVFYSGDLLGAASSSPLPGSIAPGQTVDIYLPMQAPAGGGVYFSNWELQNDRGQRFGTGSAGADKFWARIQVSWLAPGSPVAGTPAEPPSGGGSTSDTSGSCEFSTNPGYVQAVIQLINQARQQNGLAALAENGALDAAAQTHSLDMACNDHSSHTGTDGSSWPQRIAAQGYSAGLALENVYAGDPAFGGTPEGVVNWWLNSPVHRANILNPEVTEIGVGFASSPQATYLGRFTAVFARP